MRFRLFIVALALALPALAFASGTKSKQFSANLAGKNESPKGAPAGSGKADITITGNKVCWKFEKVKGIGKALAAHIHKGGPGVSGPVVVPLGAAFKATGCTTSPMAQTIVKNFKSYYVNVHTAKFPGGAIRGQLGPYT